MTSHLMDNCCVPQLAILAAVLLRLTVRNDVTFSIHIHNVDKIIIIIEVVIIIIIIIIITLAVQSG